MSDYTTEQLIEEIDAVLITNNKGGIKAKDHRELLKKVIEFATQSVGSDREIQLNAVGLTSSNSMFKLTEDVTLVIGPNNILSNTNYGLVAGDSNEITGSYPFVIGYDNILNGSFAAVFGLRCRAEADGTFVQGVDCHAEAPYGSAFGENCFARARAAHAHGHFTVASGENSHAEGSGSQASGKNAHAEGNNTNALAENSHAQGTNTYARGDNSHVGGSNNKTETTGENGAVVAGENNVVEHPNSSILSGTDQTTKAPNTAYMQIAEILGPGQGVYLTSPDGLTRKMLRLDNNGDLELV